MGRTLNIKYCITLPDATDWFPSSISITANGQTTSELGFALAGSKHDPGTFAAYRCYISTSENSIAQGESFSFSIGVIGKDGTLAGDCPRAQQALASQYPDLKFACGGVTEGVGGGGCFLFSSPTPSGLERSKGGPNYHGCHAAKHLWPMDVYYHEVSLMCL